MAGDDIVPPLHSVPPEWVPVPGVVLVIDDDDATRKLVSMWLKKNGIDVIEASSGERGLAVVDSDPTKIDAIVLDVMMPGKDGFAVLEDLRAQPESAEIPVVLLTAHANTEEDVVKGIQQGAVAHVQKPFQGAILAARVCALAESQRTARARKNRLRTVETLATKDPLTGLSNRRDFDAQLAREIASAERYGNAFSLLLLDIDHFKSINDNYGHGEGDRVLILVANQIRAALRRSDSAYRVGGEEFGVLIRAADAEAALVVARRLSQALKSEPVFFEGGDSRVVTFSAGVASVSEANGFDAARIFERADAALYAAKRGGRDRTLLEER